MAPGIPAELPDRIKILVAAALSTKAAPHRLDDISLLEGYQQVKKSSFEHQTP